MSSWVNQLLARRGYAQVSVNEAMTEVVTTVLGDGFKNEFQIGNLKGGKLHIYAADSVILQELNFRKREILQAIVQSFPDSKVSDIRFRIQPNWIIVVYLFLLIYSSWIPLYKVVTQRGSDFEVVDHLWFAFRWSSDCEGLEVFVDSQIDLQDYPCSVDQQADRRVRILGDDPLRIGRNQVILHDG